MIMKAKLLIFMIALSFFACSNESGESATDQTNMDTPVTAEGIEALAASLYNGGNKKIDSDKAMEYISACQSYATANPKDQKSAEWLLKAAETARTINNHGLAINLYNTVMDKFPSDKKVPQALFLKAFTLDENLNKKAEAKALYEEFLAKYPEDDFAKDAKFMLENLDKTDAEIIEEFERKRKEQEQAQ